MTKLTENQIHLAVMDWLKLYPKIFNVTLHIPNESKRSLSYGSLLKKMGMKKGASDLFIAYPAKKYHGAWVEIKSEKGKPTLSQINFLENMAEQGYYTAITYGLDDTIKKIQWYLSEE